MPAALPSTPGATERGTLRFDRRISGYPGYLGEAGRVINHNRALLLWALISALALMSFFVHLLNEHMQRSVVLQAEMAAAPVVRAQAVNRSDSTPPSNELLRQVSLR